MSCPACERIGRITAGRDPELVATLPESHVVLADEQRYRGYCIVFLKDHHEQLADLSYDKQTRLWDDVARVAAAIRKVTAPVRLNYACLGNFLTHVHWHVIPRFQDDPEPQHPIWVRPLSDRLLALSDGERRDLIAQLRRALGL